MKHTLKYLTLALALTTTLGLAACNKDETKAPAQPAQSSQSATPATNTAQNDATKLKNDVTQAAKDVADKAKQEANTVKDDVKKVVDSTKQVADKAVDKAKQVADQAKQNLNKAVDATKQAAKDVKQEATNLKDKVVDTATQKLQDAKDAAGKAVSAVTGKAAAAVDSAKNAVSSVKSSITGQYPADTAAIANKFMNASLQNPNTVVANVGMYFTDYLSQVAGFSYKSETHKNLAAFDHNYREQLKAGKGVFSVYNQFASDMATEATAMTDAKPNGYPALPTENTKQALDTYKTQLVKDFVKAIKDRATTYADPGYQKHFWDASKAETPALLVKAKELVHSYAVQVEALTKNPVVCQTGSYLDQAKCFREYVALLAQYPTALLSTSYLPSNGSQVVTPDFLKNVIDPVVSLYNQNKDAKAPATSPAPAAASSSSLGYTTSLPQIEEKLNGLKGKNPVAELKGVLASYPTFLTQAAGIPANSSTVAKLNAFEKNYLTKQGENASNFSLYNQFASDMKMEALNFNQAKPQYGYPELPKTNSPEAYKAYKAQFTKAFLTNVGERLKVYHDHGYAKKFLQYKDAQELKSLQSQATTLVTEYESLAKSLTAGNFACDKLATAQDQAKCFRTYMNSLAYYPSVLVAASDLGKNEKDVFITPEFEQNVVDSVTNYVKDFYNK